MTVRSWWWRPGGVCQAPRLSRAAAGSALPPARTTPVRERARPSIQDAIWKPHLFATVRPSVQDAIGKPHLFATVRPSIQVAGERMHPSSQNATGVTTPWESEPQGLRCQNIKKGMGLKKVRRLPGFLAQLQEARFRLREPHLLAPVRPSIQDATEDPHLLEPVRPSIHNSTGKTQWFATVRPSIQKAAGERMHPSRQNATGRTTPRPSRAAVGSALPPARTTPVRESVCPSIQNSLIARSGRFLPMDPAGSGRRSCSPVWARPQSRWLVFQPSKSAAHRDKSREWNVSKQKRDLSSLKYQ